MTASYDGAVLYNTLERKQRTMVAEPIPINTYQGTDKSRTVMAGYHKYGEATIIKKFRLQRRYYYGRYAYGSRPAWTIC